MDLYILLQVALDIGHRSMHSDTGTALSVSITLTCQILNDVQNQNSVYVSSFYNQTYFGDLF